MMARSLPEGSTCTGPLGQSLGAWKVDLANREDTAPEYRSAAPRAEVQEPKVATTALSVEAGQTQLNLHGADGLAGRDQD